MTPMEVLNKIVEAEVNARAVFDEAASLKEGFDNYVNEHIDELRKRYFERAEKIIAEARESESSRAQTANSELDRKLEEELADAKIRYENEKDAVVFKIFKLAVDVDA